MKKSISFAAVVFGLLIIFAVACGKGPGPAAPGEAKEGASCEGIGAMDSRIACDGQKVIACSSFTGYKYTVTMTCSAEQKCVVAKDGKSVTLFGNPDHLFQFVPETTDGKNYPHRDQTCRVSGTDSYRGYPEGCCRCAD